MSDSTEVVCRHVTLRDVEHGHGTPLTIRITDEGLKYADLEGRMIEVGMQGMQLFNPLETREGGTALHPNYRIWIRKEPTGRGIVLRAMTQEPSSEASLIWIAELEQELAAAEIWHEAFKCRDDKGNKTITDALLLRG